jgi:hypothetical protein
MRQRTFPAALIPQELQFGFQPGELKYQGDQVVGGVRDSALPVYGSHQRNGSHGEPVDWKAGHSAAQNRHANGDKVLGDQSRDLGGIDDLQLRSRDQDRAPNVMWKGVIATDT